MSIECRMCLVEVSVDCGKSIAEKICGKSIAEWLCEIAKVNCKVNDGFNQSICLCCSGKVAKMARMQNLLKKTMERFRQFKPEPFEPIITIKTEPDFVEPTIIVEPNSDDDKDPLLSLPENVLLKVDKTPDLEPCTLCNKVFSNQFFLKKHLKTAHPVVESEKPTHSCFICSKTFPYNWALTKHMLRIHPVKKELKTGSKKCFTCGRFVSASIMQIHLQNHKELARKSQCSICNFQCKSEKALQTHKKRVHDFIPEETRHFKCTVAGCDRRYLAFTMLHRHMRIKHQIHVTLDEIIPRSVRLFECSICFKTYRQFGSLRVHRHKEHNIPLKREQRKSFPRKDNAVYTCDLCETACGKRKNIVYHMQTVHMKNPKDSDLIECHFCRNQFPSWRERDIHQAKCKKLELQCCQCQVKFRETVELKEHFFLSHPEPKPQLVTNKKRRHECKLCLKRFLRRISLERHYTEPNFVEEPIKNSKTITVCETCGKIFGSRFELRTHETTNHNQGQECKYACEYEGCGKKFAMKHLLTRHTKYHKPKKFVCDLCGASYFYGKQLRHHVETHHKNGSLLTCQVCFEEFMDRNLYDTHTQTHKRYKCDQCYKGYLKKTDLTRHKKTHEGIREMVYCQHCQKPYRKRFDRNKHQEKCLAR